jgi:hypothetical protein
MAATPGFEACLGKALEEAPKMKPEEMNQKVLEV